MSVFEIGMLAAFGLSWPLSIVKSIRSTSVSGKSRAFLLIVFLGYVCGTLHKILYSLDVVIVLYVINGLMVLIDLIIVIYKRRRHLPN